ncbi:MAG: fibro-slime domain-containing protein [Cyanobacteria bacterium P01_G01_bin.39]
MIFISAPVHSEENAPSNIVLNGIIRDFSDSHPDFERTPGDASADGSVFKYGLDTDITTNNLSPDFKPQYAGGSYSTTNEENFSQWYRDVAGINQSTDFPITLVKQDDGVYRYENTNFFPINGRLIGNEGRQNNYHFTYQLSSNFTYQGGEVFDFSGDDDVWVFINGYKVIDLGGVHLRQDASISLDAVAADIGLELGNDYRFDFFFSERHTTKSNFVIETTIELASDLLAD